ncbi:ABC transporter [Longimycelium tulufanense]|uniref:ABC transporter n=1 Tax=Longimycelium tulufanense TaxID=907463 RepID=A0A8J3FUQ8_9PSEU|nr:ABC transporter ATP-binding protein [Longimycelium tulufanense]GGM61022.1 ABC transporter [Longimycelium tulufanense]
MSWVVEVEGLVKRYGRKTAVDGVSFRIAPGEVFGLLGPNGAGKTTIVQILAGLRQRGSGQVSVLGRDPAKPRRAWRDRIGVVPQSTNDHADWRVGELVGLFGRFFADPLPVSEALAQVGLADEHDQLVRKLSGGQRRRLDVAIGVVGRPELLFLDEPTTGFDPEARREFWRFVRELSGRGTAILLTTHYLDEAEQLADRVCVLDRGVIRQLATPAELGAHRDDAVVSWTGPAGPEQVRTDDVNAVLRGLVDRFGWQVQDLQVRRLSLEERYLDLIGRSS